MIGPIGAIKGIGKGISKGIGALKGAGKGLAGALGGGDQGGGMQQMAQGAGNVGAGMTPTVSSSMSPEGTIQTSGQLGGGGGMRMGGKGPQNRLMMALQRLQRSRGMYNKLGGQVGGGMAQPGGMGMPPTAMTGANPDEMMARINNPMNPQLMGGGIGPSFGYTGPGRGPTGLGGGEYRNGKWVGPV